jgi:hypothetical protein
LNKIFKPQNKKIMSLQILQGENGKPTGVFIPINEWKNIKKNYPNIEKINNEIPQWQKDILDVRLSDLNNPDKFEPIEELFKVLDAE